MEMTGTTYTPSLETSSEARRDPGLAAHTALRELALHATLPDGFSLLLVFTDDLEIARNAFEHVRLQLASGVHPMRSVTPNDVEGAAESVLQALLDDHWGRSGYWIQINSGVGTRAWDRARDEVLMRLNEKREPVRRNVNGALIVVLPRGYTSRVRELAPDLWAIRAFSTTLKREPLTAPIRLSNRVENSGPRAAPEPAPWPPGTRALWDEWERRSLEANPGLLPLSSRLMDALEAHGDPESALRVAEHALALAREATRSDASAAEGPGRPVCMLLDRIGGLAWDSGDLDRAHTVYGEHLAIARRRRARLGDSPESLRDLCVALERVGDVAVGRGDLDRARDAYRESLAIARSLRARLGDSPEALHGISVALVRVGDVTLRFRDLDAAHAAFAENLAVARTLRARLGDTPRHCTTSR
jgi:hypothetical protein